MSIENRTSFGLTADAYRRFRPVYPQALYQFLAEQCESRERALDCATGNGQAAVALADYFDYVLATDDSMQQIEAAETHKRVEYSVIAAEQLPEDLGRFDLVTVAQGAHWFDLPVFYERLSRLLKPNAVVAIWGYSHCRINKDIDALLKPLLLDLVDPYWAEGNQVIMNKYRDIEFPFQELDPPKFEIHAEWDREALFGYVRTWSAYKRLIADRAPDPLMQLAAELDAAAIWPAGTQRPVGFDICLRVGRRVDL